MKAKRLAYITLILSLFSAAACTKPPGAKLPAELKDSYRQDSGGWIYLHLAGSPREVGFQHGYHLAPEIDDALQMFAYFLEKSTGHDWAFYREAASRRVCP